MRAFVFTEVDSSNIEQVGYDQDVLLLEVLFKGGGKYWYMQVPSDVVDNLLTAESVGKYFHAHIKKDTSYPFINVTNHQQDVIFDAVLLAHGRGLGTSKQIHFSDLCDLMGWDLVEAWEKSLRRHLWLEYQDDEYTAAVHSMVEILSVVGAKDWPETVEKVLK